MAEDDAIRHLVRAMIAFIGTHPEETQRALGEYIVQDDVAAVMAWMRDDPLAPWLRSRAEPLGMVNWRLVGEAVKGALLLAGEGGLPSPAGNPADSPQAGSDVAHLIPEDVGSLLAGVWEGAALIDLDYADLGGAQLARRILSGVSLKRAFLRYADLTGADLSGVSLSGADLHGATLRGAMFHGAALDDADLRAADLREVDLRQACLNGANLSRAELDHAVLDHVQWNTATIWPAAVNAWIRSIGAWDVPSDAVGDERRLPRVGRYPGVHRGPARRRGRRRAGPIVIYFVKDPG
ncbi:pentapeptide repeat-containing protein [Nonomuraea sp. NPDC050790]|uniref:pentapeptide repeat-containing protein n=1 Tax=Nonomuraea sp. NPDC050790 TaxID=3364371 RepID=UPI0037AC2ED7